MKRLLPFMAIFALAAAALVFSERRALDVTIGPRAPMSWLGDGQREATRIPARVMRLSDADEAALGDRLAGRYAMSLSANDQAMQDYVELVGARLALHATRKITYHFHYIPDLSFENAFALPGGHVFIGGGLIALMQTEDELASVLGHEVEHVDRYHCAERAQVEAAARSMGVIGIIASLPVELFMAGYSKQQEFEADTEGVQLAVLSGYSPYGALDMMERFARRYADKQQRTPRTPVGEVARVPVQSLSEYFRSHPGGEERVSAIDRLVRRQRWQEKRAQRALKVRV